MGDRVLQASRLGTRARRANFGDPVDICVTAAPRFGPQPIFARRHLLTDHNQFPGPQLLRDSVPDRRLRRHPRGVRILPGRRADTGETWRGNWSPCDSVAQEPVEPVDCCHEPERQTHLWVAPPGGPHRPSRRGVPSPHSTTEQAHPAPPAGRPVFRLVGLVTGPAGIHKPASMFAFLDQPQLGGSAPTDPVRRAALRRVTRSQRAALRRAWIPRREAAPVSGRLGGCGRRRPGRRRGCGRSARGC